MAEHVEHQGLVVEKDGDAVALPGQGVVVKTDEGRFATLGADGNWHGYVPSTQVRDILAGDGRTLDADEASAFDPLKAAQEAKGVDVAGSEAVAPTGAIDDDSPGGGMGPIGPVGAETDGEDRTTANPGALGTPSDPRPGVDQGNVGARADRPETDIDESMRPATKAELDKRSGKR